LFDLRKVGEQTAAKQKGAAEPSNNNSEVSKRSRPAEVAVTKVSHQVDVSRVQHEKKVTQSQSGMYITRCLCVT